MTTHSTKVLTGAALAVVALLAPRAWAGKPERDRQEELTPKVAAATKSVETACGCKVEITVAWDSYKKADHMLRIPDTLEAFASNAKEHCNGAATKKAFCSSLSKLQVEYATDSAVGEPDYDAKTKTIKCRCNDSYYTGTHQFKKHTDQW